MKRKILSEIPVEWTLFFPNASEMKRKGFDDNISSCPAIFRDDCYARIPSRYLRERGAGNWYLDISGLENEGDPIAPTSQRNCGYSLLNFLKYSSAANLDLMSVTYDDVLGYQHDQVDGRWSSKGKKLSPSTANARADEACSYLAWLAARGHRGPFEIKTRHVRTRRRGRNGYTGGLTRARREKIRSGGLEVLNLPNEAEIQDWLASVRRLRGQAKMLNSRLIVEAALRKHEGCALTVDQWPSLDHINHSMSRGLPHVNLTVVVTKGSRPRVILIEVGFAKLVALWVAQQRPGLVDIYARRTGNEAPINLFVSDRAGYEGIPISPASLYLCFRPPVATFQPWYPHHGRHYWTCMSILKGLRRDAAAANFSLKNVTSGWVKGRIGYWIELARRQLGHLSDETTELYMRWMMTQIELVGIADEYSDYLGAENA